MRNFLQNISNITIPKNIEKMKIGDLDEWILWQFKFIISLEFFNVKFDVEQMSNIKSVSDNINP